MWAAIYIIIIPIIDGETEAQIDLVNFPKFTELRAAELGYEPEPTLKPIS